MNGHKHLDVFTNTIYQILNEMERLCCLYYFNYWNFLMRDTLHIIKWNKLLF